MKTLTILLILLSMTACSKKANFDGADKGGNPTGDPVENDRYKETITMDADITYSSTVKVGNNDSTLPIRNESFKIPQTLKVIQGWAGLESTAKITIVVTGSPSVVCTYRSQATKAHNNISNSNEEYESGLVYAFSSCTNSAIGPTVIVDSFDKLVLNVEKADNLETKTVVTGDIKTYQ